MTDHVVRLYAAAAGLLVLFTTWAAGAARPWATRAAPPDPRLAALQARENRLQRQSIAVRKLVAKHWSTYRAQQKARSAQLASAPAVRVVTLPPLTITRTS
jgi:hypothetical protein